MHFKKKKLPFCALVLLFGGIYFSNVSAEEVINPSASIIESSEALQDHKNYICFLEEIRQEALLKHLASSATVDYALSFSKKQPYPNKIIIHHDRNQPEFHWSWETYRNNVISPARLKQGHDEWLKQQKSLQKISEKYGVDPHIILGIWGIESHFGDVEGKHNVFAALSTLAFDGRRSKFFKKELLAALEIAGKGDISPSKMTSSYAGAMGQAQFMPTAYLRFATTGHTRGFFHPRYPNIWRNQQDVLNSIANYMKQSGWNRKMNWGEPVKINAPTGEVEIFSGTENYRTAPRHTLLEWEKLGVYPLSGNHFLYPDVTGILFQPEGSKGESFMLYPNFRVIMRYNPSEFYALAAALLGDLSSQ